MQAPPLFLLPRLSKVLLACFPACRASKKSKGFALVQFSDPQDAVKAHAGGPPGCCCRFALCNLGAGTVWQSRARSGARRRENWARTVRRPLRCFIPDQLLC